MNAAPAGPTICTGCGADLPSGILACPSCRSLVHRDELSRLAAAAKEAEKNGDLSAALTAWRQASVLLPPGTEQLAVIEARMGELRKAIDGRGATPAGVGKPGGRTGKAAAGLGAVGVAMLKAKSLLLLLAGNAKLLLLGLFKLPTLLSMLLYARWMSGAGLGMGLGIVACIYVHEVGHVAALRRYGIEATAPMFVPGFGAFVRLKQYPADAHEDARVGLAGPVWGLFAGVCAAVFGLLAGNHVATSVASWSASINLFNLIAFWQLDGARGLKALSKTERLIVAGIGCAAALALHQWMPLVVGVFALGGAFRKDAHPTGDRRMLALFAFLIVALAGLAALPAGQLVRS
jgi:Zn-dependent protease